MVNCSAYGCKSRSEKNQPGISFHSFPKDLEKRNLWVANMQIMDREPTKNDRLCSKHFEEKWLYRSDSNLRTRLLNEAIPSIFPDLPKKLQPRKMVIRLQKETDDLKKTNRRLQKEREGSLKNLSERKDFRSYPEKLSLQARSNSGSSEKDFRKEEELQQVKTQRDRLKQQLKRLEDDYQALKDKRIQDLTALQEAHERETSNYVASVTPLREQMELQQVSITTLQQQLTAAKEELAVVKAERDHLNSRLLNTCPATNVSGDLEVEALLKKISYLEKRYEEREYRLRAIVQNLAQKSITNRSCEQCAERQQQLISYKVELDQLLATVRALH